jgi:hypothetical protein
MKTEELGERGPRLREAEVVHFEMLVRAKLPVDYRRFLLATNGGEPPEDQGWFRMRTKTNRKWSRVRFFYGLRRPDVIVWQLDEDWRETLNLVDRCTLPIATDVYGNRILLTVEGPKRGAIYFWSHEWDEPIIRLAGSFAEFLDSLRKVPA